MPDGLAPGEKRREQENIWGYQHIQGKLQKLGIVISKTCVADILRRNGLPPAPERNGLSWREFLGRHADVLLCADLFTQEVWTTFGLQTAYVFFVVHLRTRTVLLAEATFSPHGKWMTQQVRNLLWECEERSTQPRLLLHDNDGRFRGGFDETLSNAGARPLRTPYPAPNAAAHAEGWVRSVRQECLNHLILFGLGCLQRVLNEYRVFFNEHRPHQGIGNRVPKVLRLPTAEGCGRSSNHPLDQGTVGCEEFLGGLLKSYYRKAA